MNFGIRILSAKSRICTRHFILQPLFDLCDIDVKDPLAAQLRAITDAAGNDPDRLTAGMLGVKEVFGDDLAANQTLRAVLASHLASL
jgi:hypothetical protein